MKIAQKLVSSLATSVAISLLFASTSTDLFAANLKSAHKVTIENRAQWMVLPQGRHVLISSDRLDFRTVQGNTSKAISLEGNHVVVGGQFGATVGVLQYADGHPHALEVSEFQLYQDDGSQIVLLSAPGFSSAILSPTGSGFAGISGAEGLRESGLKFYDPSGQMVGSKTVQFFEGGEYSRDGSHFLFKTASEGLQVSTSTGKVLKQFGPCLGWAASADASVIATTDGLSASVYQNGMFASAIQWPKSNGAIRNLSLSPDGSLLSVWSPSHLTIYDANTGVPRWSKSADEDWNHRSCDITTTGDYIAVGLDYDPGRTASDRHQRSMCVVYASDGSENAIAESSPTEWSAAYPIVRFEAGARTLLFLNKDRFEELVIE